ncbi:MAG: c-type cytochrome [Kofleriaceae bacterium]|nr:c-type cytochrome [Kofleriaceae bacterium]
MRNVLILLASLTACGNDPSEPDSSGPPPTYYADAKAIIDAKCATCHEPGGIGPFPLTSYAEVEEFVGAMKSAIKNGTMPPWQPSDDCNSYEGNFDLTTEQRTTLLAWLDADAPAGDPADAPAAPTPTPEFEADIALVLPEPYTPVREPDDYRCQLIPWPGQETRFVTGLRVTPDQRSIVHHTIVFAVGPDQVAQYMAYDAAEAGPGYTCYGGPAANTGEGPFANVDRQELLAALDRLGISIIDLQTGNITEAQLFTLMDELGIKPALSSALGSWVPGVASQPMPAGVGIRIEPGSMLVVQMHYNTQSSAPVADQSTIEIATATAVEREATLLGVVDLGWVTQGLIGEPMTIPAGEENVEHSTSLAFDAPLVTRARDTLGLAADAPLVLHTANHHMHELGRRQRTEVRHADGTTTCVLDIPDWDFHWQGAYKLENPITLRAGDQLHMGCAWDNSAANQPIVDGEPREPAVVVWGEGTSDEMCLGGFFVTRE